MEELKWYGWKDVQISGDLIGDTITKGSGKWEKEYRYIRIPSGYGYDNYCFLLSENLVHLKSQQGKDNQWWFSVCHDMKVELIYNLETREEGKRYKRYKFSGYELFEKVFSSYEVNFKQEYALRIKEEAKRQDEKDKNSSGSIIAGLYKGNNYADNNPKYQPDILLKAFFYNGKTYSNKMYDKVQNVYREYVIMENISKYEFKQIETIANAYLMEYSYYKRLKESTLKDSETTAALKKSKIVANHQPELFVETNLGNIRDSLVIFCDIAMEEIKKQMQERIAKILDTNSSIHEGKDTGNET